MTSSILEKALQELAAKEPQTLEERSAINAAIGELVRGIYGRTAAQQPVVSAINPAEGLPTTPTKTLSADSPYYGRGLREATPKVLELHPRRAMLPREIWAVLEAEGYRTAHHDPAHAVHDALRRRAKTHGDVLLVGGGKWGLKRDYTEEQLEEIRKSIGGMGGRDKGSHSEATKRGMVTALARGATPGKRKMFTAEDIEKIENLIRAGERVRDIAQQFNCTPATIYNNIDRDRLSELRSEGAKASGTIADGTRH